MALGTIFIVELQIGKLNFDLFYFRIFKFSSRLFRALLLSFRLLFLWSGASYLILFFLLFLSKLHPLVTMLLFGPFQAELEVAHV